METKQKLIIKDTTIRTLHKDGVDFICITDIARLKNPIEPKDVVKNWLRSKNTIEYLGLWESLNNPLFKGDEFDPLFREAGSNAKVMVGGAAVTQDYADEAGADAYASDGVRAVKIADSMLGH